MVLKTKSWSLLTILSRSSPKDMITAVRWPAAGGRLDEGSRARRGINTSGARGEGARGRRRCFCSGAGGQHGGLGEQLGGAAASRTSGADDGHE